MLSVGNNDECSEKDTVTPIFRDASAAPGELMPFGRGSHDPPM